MESKSYAQAVKEGGTPPRKRQDLKPSPPKLQQAPAPAAYSPEDDDYEVLESGSVAMQTTERMKELNFQLLNRESDEPVSIAEYIQEVGMRFNVDCTFMETFMLLVDREDFCIDAEYVKALGIQSLSSSSSHTLKLLEKFDAVQGRDYITRVDIVDKVHRIKYQLTPAMFKKMLIRSKNTDKYAEYYLLLEKSVYFYQIYQLELKNKVVERLMRSLTLKEDEEEKVLAPDFSIGQTFCHREDAGWVGEQSGIIGFCVVDGIGGYRAKGIDSGVLAVKFAEFVKESIKSLAVKDSESRLGLSAERVLMDAWKSVRQGNIKGGITLVEGLVDIQKSVLKICQVGDCVALVLRWSKTERHYSIIFKTSPHEKGFNKPIMLAHDCPVVENAQSYAIRLAKGDIVLVSSDGFVDNFDISTLAGGDLADFLSTSSATDIQKRLLDKATSNSRSTEETPFSRNAKSAGLQFYGGKKDDITLLVLKV